jgi:hypothetical protein
MDDRPDHDTVERQFRELLRTEGMPQPDEVAHWRDALVFGWRETKAVVVVDLDEFAAAADDPPGDTGFLTTG